MNDLVDAILDHDLDRVRKLMHVNSELASSRSQAGYLPLDIARSSGNAFTHVSLLRLGAPSEALQTPDYVWLLIEYISQLSESRACAGWLSDMEFMVYANVIGDSLNAKDPHGFGELDGEKHWRISVSSWNVPANGRVGLPTNVRCAQSQLLIGNRFTTIGTTNTRHNTGPRIGRRLNARVSPAARSTREASIL